MYLPVFRIRIREKKSDADIRNRIRNTSLLPTRCNREKCWQVAAPSCSPPPPPPTASSPAAWLGPAASWAPVAGWTGVAVSCSHLCPGFFALSRKGKWFWKRNKHFRFPFQGGVVKNTFPIFLPHSEPRLLQHPTTKLTRLYEYWVCSTQTSNLYLEAQHTKSQPLAPKSLLRMKE